MCLLREGRFFAELMGAVPASRQHCTPVPFWASRAACLSATFFTGQKDELEQKIKARWTKLSADKDAKTEDVRKFVSLFGSLFAVGREARFTLAERLIEDTEVNALLEAEQHLTVLRTDGEPAVAARAVEALARLNTRKGLLEDAAFCAVRSTAAMVSLRVMMSANVSRPSRL